MDGLEAVEIKFSVCKNIIDFRIDANTYKKDYLKSEFLIQSKSPASIEKLSISVQNFGAYSLCNFIQFCDTGIPFLMTENIRHNYIDWNVQKHIDNESHKMLHKSHCKKGQVLVTMAGEYLGRVAVYDKDEVCSSNQAIAKITLKNKISPYIVSTFLNSKHGQNQINRFRTITGQPNINMSLIKSLIIPGFSDKFQRKVEVIIKKSSRSTSESKEAYKLAEELLLTELYLIDFKPSTENIAIKSFSESFGNSGRLDSEYYQPKYDEIEDKISKNINKTFVKDQFIQIKTSFDRLKQGYNYIEIGNVNVSDGTNISNYVETEYLPANAKINVANGDLLVSTVRPNRGAITIINTQEKYLIVSGAFTVLRKKEEGQINTQVLQVLLRTKIYKELLLKYNVGTQYPVIKDEDVMNLIVPVIDKSIQNEVEQKIKASLKLKTESNKLLDLAKQAVETAIEQDEAAAIKLIETYES